MRKRIGSLIISIVIAGCASSTVPKPIPGNVNSLSGLQQMATGGYSGNNKPLQTQVRINAIKETALSLGAQSGLAASSKAINAALNTQANALDRAFDFRALVLENNILPPILLEGRNTLVVDDPTTLRLADSSYQILQQARFVTAPPNWREYLLMSFTQPDLPDRAFLPQNKDERDLWNEYVAAGWKSGVEQANHIFAENIARLRRDMLGMITYRRLLAQHMVSAPFVASSDLGITGGGDHMRIRDQILRITALPSLQADSKTWTPAVAKSDLAKSDFDVGTPFSK